jgi:hypothetical protein
VAGAHPRPPVTACSQRRRSPIIALSGSSLRSLVAIALDLQPG